MQFQPVGRPDSNLFPGFCDRPGLYLLPSFYKPETEDLRKTTHNNIRMTLFDSVFRKIKYCEYKRLSNQEEDYFRIKRIEPVEESIMDVWIEQYWSREKADGSLIETQKWTITRGTESSSEETEGHYKVKVYHMNTDEFKCKLYPYSWLDTARFLWFDRDYFRIL